MTNQPTDWATVTLRASEVWRATGVEWYIEGKAGARVFVRVAEDGKSYSNPEWYREEDIVLAFQRRNARLIAPVQAGKNRDESSASINPNSPDWLDGYETAAAEHCVIERRRVKELEAEIANARQQAYENAARICEDTVTFTENHRAPQDHIGCGWCEGLETAAAAIRRKAQEARDG